MYEDEHLIIEISQFAAAIRCSRYLAYQLSKQHKLPGTIFRLGKNRMVVSREEARHLFEAKYGKKEATDV